MAASFATLNGLHGSLVRSQFLGQDNQYHHLTHHFFPLKQTSTSHHRKSTSCRAEFNILEIMGGRGICKGEKGIEQELKRHVDDDDDHPPPTPEEEEEEETESSDKEQEENSAELITSDAIPKDAFEKEMMGLTGGFPGGEKGLIKFIEENPTPQNRN